MLPSGILISALFFLCSITGTDSVNIVTLGSIEIFSAHEWFPSKPTVYFHCRGEENKTVLPDVKKTHVLYNFKGEESWQPLTELPDQKCKRCGFYEKDKFKSDDVFDEWELCAADFVDGKYLRFKENEFNATFICPLCNAAADSEKEQGQITSTKRSKRNVALIVIICALASLIVMAGMVAAYKYWQKRKREQDQARFLKLFDEGDDIEDELSLDPVF
ncbi:uncharacterized protein LOC110026686 [Phalaenopsis equestris]|uniref:uncharacterized protein LOC110026686 n=1 Tax=Phalaenopsis equestris TaxID=78828 RepID=UPI0009E2DCE4|nr:uncharacterized protein LOC110026686 [Phalaenopsis equestris]